MVTINTLNGNNIEINTSSSGGGSSGHAETIFTFTNNRTASKNVSGELKIGNCWKYDEDVEGVILDYDGPDKLLQQDLVTVDIGNTVTSIYDWIFSQCSGLTSVTIGNSVESIGLFAFNECTGLTGALTIPSSVTSIGTNAFQGCTSLTSVIFLGKTMEQVQDIEDADGNKQYPWGISDTSIISVA